MDIQKETSERIILSAYQLFMQQGIKKTSMSEIAEQAGVTRITAYRYFDDKAALVQAAFMHPISIFQQAQETIIQQPGQNVASYLDIIGLGLAALPQGDLPTRLEELKILYPEIAQEFHSTRLKVVKNIFDRLFEAANQQGLLREGVNQKIVQVVFMEAVTNALENPQLHAMGLTPNQIFQTVKSIFLYGIFLQPAS